MRFYSTRELLIASKTALIVRSSIEYASVVGEIGEIIVGQSLQPTEINLFLGEPTSRKRKSHCLASDRFIDLKFLLRPLPPPKICVWKNYKNKIVFRWWTKMFVVWCQIIWSNLTLQLILLLCSRKMLLKMKSINGIFDVALQIFFWIKLHKVLFNFSLESSIELKWYKKGKKVLS